MADIFEIYSDKADHELEALSKDIEAYSRAIEVDTAQSRIFASISELEKLVLLH